MSDADTLNEDLKSCRKESGALKATVEALATEVVELKIDRDKWQKESLVFQTVHAAGYEQTIDNLKKEVTELDARGTMAAKEVVMLMVKSVKLEGELECSQAESLALAEQVRQMREALELVLPIYEKLMQLAPVVGDIQALQAGVVSVGLPLSRSEKLVRATWRLIEKAHAWESSKNDTDDWATEEEQAISNALAEVESLRGKL